MAHTSWGGRPLLLRLASALILLAVLCQPLSIARAQSLYTLVATPTVTATGGQFRVNGTGWPTGRTVYLRLRQGGTTIALGTLNTGRLGVLSGTLTASGIDPGDYELLAVNVDGAPFSAPIPFKVAPAPLVTLSPTSGPPGTVVTVSVSRLLPGSLAVSYAGAAVIGPVAVAASSYTGIFIVPADRPAPLGSTTVVDVVNAVGGLRLGESEASFGSRPGSPRPSYGVTGLTAPLAQVQPGGTFTMHGRLTPAPVGPTDQIKIAPFWTNTKGQRFPIGAGQARISPDGSFEVEARAPSRLRGDPASSHTGDTFGVEIRAPGGLTVQTMTSDMAQPTGVFTVRVVKPNGQPVPNTPKPAPDAVPPLRVLIEPVDSFHLTAAQADAAFSTGSGKPVIDLSQLGISDSGKQAIQGRAIQIANCYREISSIPEWEWRMSPDESAFVSTGETPGLNLGIQRQTAAIHSAGAAGAAAEDDVLVQSLRVTVDASRVVDNGQQGYGEVDSAKQFIPTVKYYLYIPSRKRAYLLDEITATASAAPLPVQIALAPLPVGWKSRLAITFVDVVNDNEPPLAKGEALGPYYSFAGETDILFDPHNIRIRTALDQLPTAAPNVRMRLGNEALSVVKVVEPPAEEPPGGCAGGQQTVLPESAYTYYEAEIPNSHVRPPGSYTLTIEADDGAVTKVSKQVGLSYVSYKPYTRWFDGPQAITKRSVAWYPGGAVLRGTPFDETKSRLDIGEDVEEIPGPQRSMASLGGEVVTSLYPAYLYSPSGTIEPWQSYESTRSQTGSMKGSSLDNATTPQSFGQGSDPALASLPSIQSTSTPAETYDILDTGRITIFKAGYGIPEIAFIGISVDFRIKATLALNYTLALNDIGLQATLDSQVDVRVKVDVDVLLGLADAEVGVNPIVGVQIPLELSASKGTSDLGACFHYAMNLYYEISVLWGLGSWDGEVSIFDGDEADGCYEQLPSLMRGLSTAQAEPKVAEASPALATDGLGNTIAVWRTDAGNIAASKLIGGGWGPEQTIVANGKSGNPAIAFFAPNQAVAVWSQSGLTTAPTPGTPLAAILKQQHLAYALWDGGAWSVPQSLTLPSGGDGKAALAGCMAGAAGCPAGGAVTAVWVHDAVGAYDQRQFRIYSATYQGGAWSAPQQVDGASGASETEPQVVYRNGQALAFWVRDGDRSPQTTGDRRLALRPLAGGPTIIPPNVPAGVLRPRVAIDQGGQLQVAYTTVTPGDGIVGNRHPLQRAVVAGCDVTLSGCTWATEQVKDGLGRTIFAESPVVAVDSTNKVVLTYRAMGMSPFTAASGPGAAMPEPAGLQSLTGELAQLQLGPSVGGPVGLPTYLTSDGAVNWRPAAVYDPQLNSMVALAVKGAVSGAAALPEGEVRLTPLAAPASALAFASTPRMPNFVLGKLTPAGPTQAGALPKTVGVTLQNSGTDWQQQIGEPALTIQATWDGALGIGAPAGQATLTGLEAGEAVTLDLSLLDPPADAAGRHTLVVTVNPGQALAEASGEDNSLSLELGQLPPPEQAYATAPAGSPTVLLTWTPTDDPRVIGYRIYRIDASGVRTAVGSSFEPSWVDINAAFGQSYRYDITSFGSDLSESSPSMAVTATPGYAPLQKVYLPLARH